VREKGKTWQPTASAAIPLGRSALPATSTSATKRTVGLSLANNVLPPAPPLPDDEAAGGGLAASAGMMSRRASAS